MSAKFERPSDNPPPSDAAEKQARELVADWKRTLLVQAAPEANRDLIARITTALESAAAEAREAGVKEAIATIVGLPVDHYIYSGAHPMAATTFRDNAVKTLEAVIRRKAAAISTEKGKS